MSEDFFQIEYPGYAPLEITLKDADDFLKIRETLSRIGVASRKEQVLYQSCHILHKQGRYSILHFKELFILDGKKNTFTDEDEARRNTIVNLLEEWDLISIVAPQESEKLAAPINQIKILSHKEKSNWILEAKYNIGKK